MSLKTQSKEIGGDTFTVSQLPMFRALRLLNRIGRAVGPALGHVASAYDASKGDGAPVDGVRVGEAVGRALSALFGSLSDDELEAITRAMLETAMIESNGKTTPLLKSIDLVMQGRILDLFKLLAFAFEVNYGDFFEVVPQLIAAARATEAAPKAEAPQPA